MSTRTKQSLQMQSSTNIGLARILSGGALFLTKNVDDLFMVVALKERLNTPVNLTRPAKTVLKIDSCSGWGVHFVSKEVHLHILPVNYA